MNDQSPAEALQQQINKSLDFFTEPGTGEKYLKDLEDELVTICTAYAATVEREARKDELLEIGLLAHKFEGEDYHCREIADTIDDRLAALQGPIQGDSNTSEEASSAQ